MSVTVHGEFCLMRVRYRASKGMSGQGIRAGTQGEAGAG